MAYSVTRDPHLSVTLNNPKNLLPFAIKRVNNECELIFIYVSFESFKTVNIIIHTCSLINDQVDLKKPHIFSEIPQYLIYTK